MGCLNSKNVTNDDSTDEKKKVLNKNKEGSVEKSNNTITNTKGFNINISDLVGEKTGNINLFYNLLMPPLGKGKEKRL